jgi:flagellar motor switch protein FliM
MYICFPYSMLEPIRDLLYSAMQSDQLSTDQHWIKTLRRQLKDAEVEVVATLGTATVTLGEILKLKTGDIIPLDVPDKIFASVDDIPVLECIYGQQGGQYALKINRFIAQNDDGKTLQGLSHG